MQRVGGPTFLSNVNACYARACWAEIRFPDVAYAEDQAFGRAHARGRLAQGLSTRARPCCTRTTTAPVEFMRRYFDEYRGLRETIGHVEPCLRGPLAASPAQVAGDLRWMREQGWPRAGACAGRARSAVHHSGRQVLRAVSARASERLPAGVQRALSLEGRDGAAGRRTPEPSGRRAAARPRRSAALAASRVCAEMLRLSREGPAPLAEPVAGHGRAALPPRGGVIPPFARGSGGHSSIFQIVARLERDGPHLLDLDARPARRATGSGRRCCGGGSSRSSLPLRAPVFKGFDDWYGADVVVATGWETAYPTMLLPDCRARAYLIHDHEPEFFATSAEHLWAEQTYELGPLPDLRQHAGCATCCATATGSDGSWFRFGVDHGIYRPRPVRAAPRHRHRSTRRDVHPARAVPLAMLALDELHRRRPDVRIVLFGDTEPTSTLPFPYEFLGVVMPEVLAWRYSEATVGLCLSLTNYSLIPQEMMACGLPCVDLAGGSPEAEFGRDGGVELAAADPLALADASRRCSTTSSAGRERSRAGLAFVETALVGRAAAAGRGGPARGAARARGGRCAAAAQP